MIFKKWYEEYFMFNLFLAVDKKLPVKTLCHVISAIIMTFCKTFNATK